MIVPAYINTMIVPATIYYNNTQVPYYTYNNQNIDYYRYEYWNTLECCNIQSNMYEISTFGRIRHLDTRQIIHQIDSATKDSIPYKFVRLLNIYNGHQRFFVHRLMAYTFLNGIRIPTQYSVNHIDGNPQNNSLWNLEWCTYSYNSQHARDNNLIGNIRSVRMFDDCEVELICSLLENNTNYRDILCILDMDNTDNNRDLIGMIKRGITYKYISCKYNINKSNKNCRFSNDDIHIICQCLQDGCTSFDIALKFDIDVTNERERETFYVYLGNIRRRRFHTDISCQYNVDSNSNSRLPILCESTVRHICECITNGLSNKEISDVYNISSDDKKLCNNFRTKVDYIRKRKTFKEISKDYDW